jgi:transposase
MQCSFSTLYRLHYEQLELELRQRQYPWPRSIGIDEHKYAKNREKHYAEFATIFVDHKGKRVFEVVKGRDVFEVKRQIDHIPGRDNVKLATIDLSSTYRRLIRETFPNAAIVADKFHVVRLLHPAINKRRKEITGDKRKLRIRKLLLRSGKNLDYFTRAAIHKWLENHQELREIYNAKEAIHGLYRIRGYKRACKAYQKLLDRLGHSTVPEIKTFRKTLLSWRKEILEYFRNRITNGRTEAFNGKAKLIRKMGYGFRSFPNYRLRLLTWCT